VKRAPAALTGTSLGFVAPKGPALPFAAATPAAPPPKAKAPVVSVPQLSLEQYASLCVELELDPTKTEETLGRYRLSADQRKALDEAWQPRVASDPTLHTAFNAACAAYKAWLVSSRGA
jgi:hypothetical protein